MPRPDGRLGVCEDCSRVFDPDEVDWWPGEDPVVCPDCHESECEEKGKL
jgi:hypothetical protein